MNSFRFGLESVLEWRRRQLEAAEDEFEKASRALADLDRLREQVRSEGQAEEARVRTWPGVTGADLAALSEFRRRVSERIGTLAKRRIEGQRDVAERQQAMLEARRRARLLERLRERRWEEWRAAGNRELEELAAESFLARWNRERRNRAHPG